MVLGKVGYGPVGYSCHELLWGVTILVVHNTPQGLHSSPYNGMPILERDYRYESGWHTWKNVTSDTTQDKQITTEASKTCVVPV